MQHIYLRNIIFITQLNFDLWIFAGFCICFKVGCFPSDILFFYQLTAKNIQCMRTLLNLAHCHGAVLGTSWQLVLATLQVHETH